ncbi:MerR family transcriptional regulator [Bacillus cereus]|uniref:MerR family transcriptional regulator n=1 Tax=Bacillus cereus group TaxID=86661 RepID=UPI00240627E8|nr:MerR family transcriptional regulator [Bacillus cereus]MDF9530631.1 MerR family transcriptional regulator [Bacillus cereus]MDG1578905.1 MerR family transcriptional regulator [Bacillus cereus]
MSKVISLERPQRPLNSSDVVNVLNIPASTLRTYTGHFRHLGHSFSKKNGRILYSSYDLQLLQRMIQLHEQGFGTIPECVVNVLNVQNNVVDVHNVLNSVEDIVDNVDKQNEQCKQAQDTSSPIETANEIAKIRQEMEELRKYVDESIKKRDELLLQTLREVLESKQKKKKKWWQFWK